MEGHGRGWSLRRLAMRKANMHNEGAMSLAGAIRRAAAAVVAFEKTKDGSGAEIPGGAPGETKCTGTRDLKKPLCRLRWLDLGSNMIQDEGAVALAEALGPAVPITRLNIRDNQVGVHGCLAIGHAVARCSTTLRRLDLAHAGFGDAGAVALARGLRTAGAFTPYPPAPGASVGPCGAVNPKPRTPGFPPINLKPYTLHSEPSTLNPKP